MKRRAPAPIDDADSRLFREAIGEVRQLDPVAPPPTTLKPAPHQHMLEADEAAVPCELLDMAFDPALLEVDESLGYLREVRSEARRVGIECVITCSSRRTPHPPPHP